MFFSNFLKNIIIIFWKLKFYSLIFIFIFSFALKILNTSYTADPRSLGSIHPRGRGEDNLCYHCKFYKMDMKKDFQ
jgi:hypothetical protein